MTGFLLDTNIPSELTRPRPDSCVEAWLEAANNDELFFSVVSLGEIVKGVALLDAGRKRDELHHWLQATLRPWFASRLLPIDESVAAEWGRLTAKSERAGRKIKVADGLIAATATVHGLVIATRNVKDFDNLGIKVFNPWEQS